MNVALTAFLYVAIASSVGALTFLMGQRASGRTPKEVDECHEQATLLEGARRELEALYDEAHRAGSPAPTLDEIDRARIQLDEAILGLRRGADLVV
ncbi:MAG: hypothetical protein ACYDCK_00840 [Thermoplasmatota archaeon]